MIPKTFSRKRNSHDVPARLGVLVLSVVAADAHAQYPTRPIRLLAAQSAGSSLDTIARMVMPKTSEILGQQIVIDNRGGAGGTIGVELALADPDVVRLYATQGLQPSGS